MVATQAFVRVGTVDPFIWFLVAFLCLFHHITSFQYAPLFAKDKQLSCVKQSPERVKAIRIPDLDTVYSNDVCVLMYVLCLLT